jgi:glycosyltransferase involved in cell wall biosynthesis
MHRWMVAGAVPMNVGLALARGAWIAPCDDDDELSPDHVEVLLGAARARRLEMVYSKARRETAPGAWGVVGSEPLRHGRITHGSVLYSLGLRFMRHGATSWKLNEPSDWNLWKRMRRIGVRIGFLDRVTYTHYLEAYRRVEHAVP